MGEFAKKVIWERGDSELWTRVSTAVATTSKRSWHKVTVDGGLSRDGSKRETAAVCRTEHAQFLGASVNVLDGHNDPACLEALACNEGLALASSRSGHWYSVFGFGLFRDGDKLPKEGLCPPARRSYGKWSSEPCIFVKLKLCMRSGRPLLKLIF